MGVSPLHHVLSYIMLIDGLLLIMTGRNHDSLTETYRSTRLSGPAAEAPDNQRRSKKRSDIRIVKMRVCLFFFFSVFFYQNEGERRKVKKRNEGMMMVWGL